MTYDTIWQYNSVFGLKMEESSVRVNYLYILVRESKRSGENSDIFTLTYTQFPQFLMLQMPRDWFLYPNKECFEPKVTHDSLFYDHF